MQPSVDPLAQSIAGINPAWLVTVPVPAPEPGLEPGCAIETVSVKFGGGKLNVAVTVSAAFIVTEHVPVPEHPAPLQPANTDPDAGAAVSVTFVPPVKLAEHPFPQVIPAGLLVTVPAPVPANVTVSV